MRIVAECVGWLFMVCWICGAFFRGLSFHVYFGDDCGAFRWHMKHAENYKNVRE